VVSVGGAERSVGGVSLTAGGKRGGASRPCPRRATSWTRSC